MAQNKSICILLLSIVTPSKHILECPLLTGLGSTASHSLSFLTPAWSSASNSQGDSYRNLI